MASSLRTWWESVWQEDRALLGILLFFLVLGTAYNVVVPVMEKPDERWHYPVIKHLADNHTLPVYDPSAGDNPWKQQASQAPLYYTLAALVTFPIPTDDFWTLRTQTNPFYLSYLQGPLGDNDNMFIHYPDQERFPYRGAVLAMHLARELSVLMGLLTLIATWRIARDLLPDRPDFAILATALVAFNPQFLFIASSVSNDATVAATSAWAAWAALRLAIRDQDHTLQSATRVGILTALALLSKSNAIALLPLIALALLIHATRRRSWQALFLGSLSTILPILLLVGWWWWRNWHLYGDPTGVSVHQMVFANREPPPWLQLFGELKGVEMSFWALFGWRSIEVDALIYWALMALDRLALLGLAFWIIRQLRNRRTAPNTTTSLLLIIVWVATAFAALLQFMRVAWGHHGRLLFPAIAGIACLLAWGIRELVPQRYQPALTWGLGGTMLALSITCIPLYLIPSYAPPPALTQSDLEAIPYRTEIQFGGMLTLLGYDVDRSVIHPGDELHVTLYWRADAPMPEDYTVFIHVLDEIEAVIAQRDTYPGLGRQPTSRWPVGKIIADTYAIPIPLGIYTPGKGILEIGVYRHTDGIRLPATRFGQLEGDAIRFWPLAIEPAQPSEIPNAMEVHFGDRIALIGYQMGNRIVAPGEALDLTLYWKALADGEQNYTVFVHILGSDQSTRGQVDQWPRAGEAPTAAWQAGQVITDPYHITVFPDTPPGVYLVEVGLYRPGEGRLRVHDPQGLLPPDANRILLAPIRVRPPSSDDICVTCQH